MAEIAWHFCKSDMLTQFTSESVLQPLTATGQLSLCDNGLHASRRLIDALGYAPGLIVCRVELTGETLKSADKLCSRHRRVLWYADATEVLQRFARLCALDVIHLWDAPDVVVDYLKTGKPELRAAAWSDGAARSNARHAAKSAADADVGAGARYAACWSASAAKYATTTTAAAAWSAARTKQNRRLTSLISRLPRCYNG